MQNITRRNFVSGLGLALGSLGMAACSSAAPAAGSAAGSAAKPKGSDAAAAGATRVAVLKGPTAMGLAKLMQDAEAGTSAEDYQFNMYTNPADEVLPLLVKGKVDIACLPANVAAVAYAKTKGGVVAIDVNTLGVLYLVTGDASVAGLADLAGRTVYVPNKGASPDYVTQYLLRAAGVADQVTLEYKTEPTEIVAALAADPKAAGVLPEPFATAALTKNQDLVRALDLTEEWEKAGAEGQLVTGVTVARAAFAQESPDAVNAFLDNHASSVDAVNDDPETYGKAVADLGIVDAAPVAAKAIPNCNLVCVTGADMKEALEGYFQVLLDADPTSVGGALPGDDFYFGA